MVAPRLRVELDLPVPEALPHVLFKDPDWFFWAIEDGAFQRRPLEREAERIALRLPSPRLDVNEITPAVIAFTLLGRNVMLDRCGGPFASHQLAFR